LVREGLQYEKRFRVNGHDGEQGGKEVYFTTKWGERKILPLRPGEKWKRPGKNIAYS